MSKNIHGLKILLAIKIAEFSDMDLNSEGVLNKAGKTTV